MGRKRKKAEDRRTGEESNLFDTHLSSPGSVAPNFSNFAFACAALGALAGTGEDVLVPLATAVAAVGEVFAVIAAVAVVVVAAAGVAVVAAAAACVAEGTGKFSKNSASNSVYFPSDSFSIPPRS